MKTAQAIELLRGGSTGIQAWNEKRRGADEEAIRAMDSCLAGADLSQSDLRGADLCRMNLKSVKLRGCDLTSVSLWKSVLARADLRDSHVVEADLRECDLSGANFSGARLVGCDFTGAELCGASFRNSQLPRTVFARTGLDRVDFSRAVCGGTLFADVDLSVASGLDQITHAGRSEVGIHTLQRSAAGGVPECFLKGCGYEDELFASNRITTVPPAYYSCFISYSHADNKFAQKLFQSLQEQGVACWLDEKQIRAGDYIFEEIDRGVRLWDKVLLCASRTSLTSWWVDKEVTSAFAKEQALMKRRGKKVSAVIPLNLDGFMFSSECSCGWKNELTTRLAADFIGWKSDSKIFENGIQLLLHALEQGWTGNQPPPSRI